MTLKRHDDRDGPGPMEKGFMVLSVVVVAGLFGITVYQAVTAPEGPSLSVRVVELRRGEATLVEVELRNEGSTGWKAVTVEVDCDDPPPQATLENLPAGSVRTVAFSCPADVSGVQARISSRVPA